MGPVMGKSAVIANAVVRILTVTIRLLALSRHIISRNLIRL